MIEQTPSSGIDPARLGVTGCSRDGKGALGVGAMDERIVLTIPQESGEGGAGGWRTADAQGTTVQTLSEIVGENVWFSSALARFTNQTNLLPFDQHEALALVAPRALLVIENTVQVWLGNQSTYNTSWAAHEVWEALGVPDRMGFSQLGHSDHCGAFPPQEPDVEAFVKKFLIGAGGASTPDAGGGDASGAEASSTDDGGSDASSLDATAMNTDATSADALSTDDGGSASSINTAIWKTDGNYGYQTSMWQDWSVPTLR